MSPRTSNGGGRARGAHAILRWYYGLKYAAFRRARRPTDDRRGLIALQIDALAYADLRRALELGYCPTLAHLIDEEGFTFRRWFCGLPSATPYCQAGIFHGENAGIPAFRFYDKLARRVITCNAPRGVQYIRDRIHAPGALAGGSSYVNLLDGDADTVAFTVATRERSSTYHRLGGTRMALLTLLHPVRVARMAVQGVAEWLLEEWERAQGEWTRRVTHAEGIFPFLRILSGVVVRELQTMAILLDIHLGVPVIYSTFMQYDELGHHFGPSSTSALRDLRRTDARIAEIWRMVRTHAGRAYDLVILSDHGMTPATSYRVRFQETLGTTIERILDGDVPPHARRAPPRDRRGRVLRRVRGWLRRQYGLRELVLPEKYFVDARHEVVATYSSSLAHVYFADDARQLELRDVTQDDRRAALYAALLAHPGIGLVATRQGGAVLVEGTCGRARIVRGALELLGEGNPLARYGDEPYLLRAIESLVLQPNAGDLVLFGAYDGHEIVSFDDQVGAHGSAGGDQTYPFVLAPPSLGVEDAVLEDARDIHRVIMRRYVSDGPADRSTPG